MIGPIIPQMLDPPEPRVETSPRRRVRPRVVSDIPLSKRMSGVAHVLEMLRDGALVEAQSDRVAVGNDAVGQAQVVRVAR